MLFITPAALPPIKPTVNAYSLLGNPYASPVNWNLLTKTDLSTTYTIWDPTQGTTGAYTTYNGSSGQNNGGSVNNFIQPGQAFYVQPSGTNPSLTFLEAAKGSTFTTVFRDPNPPAKLSVALTYVNEEGERIIADGTVAVFSPNYSRNLGDEDSYKFINPEENIAIASNNATLSIEGRSLSDMAEPISLQTWQYSQKKYNLLVVATNFPAGTQAFVKDAFLQNETAVAIGDSTSIPFSITAAPASSAANRFSIVFRPGTVIACSVTDIKAAQKGNGINIDWQARCLTNIVRYELERSANGIEFNQVASSAARTGTAIAAYNWFDAKAQEGDNYYRIKDIDRSGQFSYSQVAKVAMLTPGGAITVYPNPVTGNNINLHLANLPGGTYTISLYNSHAQKVVSKSISFTW